MTDKYRQRPNNPLIVQQKLGAGRWVDIEKFEYKTHAAKRVKQLNKQVKDGKTE